MKSAKLSTKGWSKEEIAKIKKILKKAKKHPKIVMLDKSVYWIALFLIILGNITFSIFLIPILVTFSNVSMYLIILVLAISFGIIMSIIVRDIENLENYHHIAAFIIIIIAGLISFSIIVKVANNNPVAEALSISHNPYLIGVIYLAGFIIPYSYFVFEEKWRR